MGLKWYVCFDIFITGGKAPFGPREAFMGQSDNIIEEMSLENESIGVRMTIPSAGRIELIIINV